MAGVFVSMEDGEYDIEIDYVAGSEADPDSAVEIDLSSGDAELRLVLSGLDRAEKFVFELMDRVWKAKAHYLVGQVVGWAKPDEDEKDDRGVIVRASPFGPEGEVIWHVSVLWDAGGYGEWYELEDSDGSIALLGGMKNDERVRQFNVLAQTLGQREAAAQLRVVPPPTS